MSILQDLDKILEDALDDVPCPKCGNTFHDSKFIAYLENGNERLHHCLKCGYNFVEFIASDHPLNDVDQLTNDETIKNGSPGSVEPDDIPF